MVRKKSNGPADIRERIVVRRRLDTQMMAQGPSRRLYLVVVCPRPAGELPPVKRCAFVALVRRRARDNEGPP